MNEPVSVGQELKQPISERMRLHVLHLWKRQQESIIKKHQWGAGWHVHDDQHTSSTHLQLCWVIVAYKTFVNYTIFNKDDSFANKSVWRNDSLTRTNWPDSTVLFSLIRSVVLTDESLCCSLFSDQTGEEEREPANRMLSLGHCRRILANEKQESIATVSMRNTFHFIRSSPLSYRQYMSI